MSPLLSIEKKYQQPSELENKIQVKKNREHLDISNIVSALSFYSKRAIPDDILQESDSEKILISPQKQPTTLPKSAKSLKIG